MTLFYSISSFREALSELIKVRKNVYAGIEKEIFLTVYPKNGPSQRISVSKDELKSLLSQYLSEVSEGILQSYGPLTTDN